MQTTEKESINDWQNFESRTRQETQKKGNFKKEITLLKKVLRFRRILENVEHKKTEKKKLGENSQKEQEYPTTPFTKLQRLLTLVVRWKRFAFMTVKQVL